jgi:hypothetical protein
MNIDELRRSTSPASARRALEHGEGILRLAPTWVPRSFCVPGRRIRLHPDDYFALGGERGGIDERWLSSAIRADNGPLTGPDEGLSFVVAPEGEKVPLDEAVAELGPDLIGERIWSEHAGWPVYSKFFDNQGRLPFHIHHRQEHATLVGQMAKPEAYYFSPQMNNHLGDDPFTYFGLIPGTTEEEFARRIADFGDGDNRITELAQAYRLELGTGWDVPAGIVHAPASLCTYEPQCASDVFAMCESLVGGRIVPGELLWKDVPAEHHGDVEFIVSLLDWEANVDPAFAQSHFMRPLAVGEPADGHEERWIVYRSPAFSAKELTVEPGATALVADAAAYGCIAVQGQGTIGGWPLENRTLIRFGELTFDEYFVSEQAAREGVTFTNASASEPLVLLKHFGPGNPDNESVE